MERDPKLFIWTKTADQILKSLGDYRNGFTTQDTRTSEFLIVYAPPARATGRCCPTWEEWS